MPMVDFRCVNAKELFCLLTELGYEEDHCNGNQNDTANHDPYDTVEGQTLLIVGGRSLRAL